MNLQHTAKLFGSDEEPLHLLGGQGNTFKSGGIILKPTENPNESEELAELISSVSSSKRLRIPIPIQSVNGNWVEEGYVAWAFLEGQESPASYEQKLQISDWFSDIFEQIEKPAFIERRNDPWSIADKVTWGEIDKEYEGEFQEIIEIIQGKLVPIELPSQIIHGDIAGNIIFDKHNTPGVIDITLYWRPRDFAKALLIVDAITWENADLSIYSLVDKLPEMNQLLLRAGLRRIIENPEHVRSSGKDRKKALEESKKYLQTLRLLKVLETQ